MSYKAKQEDYNKLRSMVWLKSTAKKQDKPAPSFRSGQKVCTEADHTGLTVISSLGAYTLVVNEKTEVTDVISSFRLIKKEDDVKGAAACLSTYDRAKAEKYNK